MIFQDIYKRSKFLTNDRPSYDSQHISSSRIFREDNLWIITRVGFEESFLISFFNDESYPVSNSWNETNGNNVNKNLKNCFTYCRKNMFPTSSPSSVPSVIPSRTPTFNTHFPTTTNPSTTPSFPPTLPPLLSGTNLY